MRYLLVAIICLIAPQGRATTWYWCAPLHAYYPQVQTCPIQWRAVETVDQPQAAQPEVSGISAIEAAFHAGLLERTAWENWDASLTGDYRAGADYWASHRSIANPGTCSAPIGVTPSSTWTAGCSASKARLDPTDTRRRSDDNYRHGWNSHRPVVAMQAPAMSVAPAPPTVLFPQQIQREPAEPRLQNEEKPAAVQPTAREAATDVGTPRKPSLIVPIEDENSLYDKFKGQNELLNELVVMVLRADDKCDSISSALPFLFSAGFSLSCNHYRYSYEIADKGGHWVVTVK